MSLPPFQKTPAFRLHGGAEEVLSNKLDEVLLPLLQRYQDSNGVGGKLDNEGWQILKYGVGQHFRRLRTEQRESAGVPLIHVCVGVVFVNLCKVH